MIRETRRERRIRKEKHSKAKRRKIYSRVALLFTMVSISAILGINALTTAFARDTVEFHTITVTRGDTLWDIAKEYNVNNKDIRKIVDSIMRANNMKTTVVYAGEVLNIPIN